MNPFLTANLAAEKKLQAEVEQELLSRRKLLRIFDIGWQVGVCQEQNKPISHQNLQCSCNSLLKERDKLIKELLNNGQYDQTR